MDSLKKYSRLLAIVVVAVVAGVIVLSVQAYQRNHHTAALYKTVEACNILKADIARQLQGNNLRPDSLKPVDTDATVTTYCVFRGASSSVSLTVRSPKNQAGVDFNKAAFASPPLGGQTVYGYGDQAYWLPSLAQLNILAHDRWYILSNGSNTPSNRTLTQAEDLAKKIIAQL